MVALIGRLPSTGLRSGEVVRLDRSDVDLTNGGRPVRKTKFRKDRLVPVHPTIEAALRRYARERDAVFFAQGASFSAPEAAACKATSLKPASSRVLMMVSCRAPTISGSGSR
ncbi:tyrosine-type recombinase/integrase [Bradyrhizobium ivorense]|uniref:tyrosine-type recombinase/integrase n=1 Tax=Bradyrhizobium ivorense TaxID=2511166 RepID=UPI0035586F6B